MTHEEWMKRQKIKWNPYYLPLDSRMWDVIRVKCMYKAYLSTELDEEVLMHIVYR
ncbi:hypothetical protein Ecwhy1_36 [Escherichia phage Ecwhy_1]|nr:hypothetical protein Ecwhy1_36 [Escherichia phage Ecwhy_1]